ncbi:MAG: tetratricopeptide repeat protein [Candidatus Brocadiales bacterium]
MYRNVATVLITCMLFALGCSNYGSHRESYANLVRGGNIPISKHAAYQDSVILHKALGEKYYSDRRYQLAIEEFSMAAELAPGDAGAYEGLGRSYREIGKLDKAIEALEKGLALVPPSQISPTHAKLRNTKAVTYDMMGKYREAIVEYEKAIELDLTNDSYYNNMGFSYLLQKRVEESLSAFKKAIEINPDNKTTHSNLGYAYGLKGAYELALNEFRLASDEASAYNNMGYIYTKNGKLSEAIESYDNALKINPNIPSTYYNKGRAYELLGDADKAIQAYQEFLKYTTKPSAAEEAFDRMQALKRRNEEKLTETDLKPTSGGTMLTH